MHKAIFLDRDGVINEDDVNYVYTIERFILLPGVPEALQKWKTQRYLLVVITNQAGIAKGLYGHPEVKQCHDYLQTLCQKAIDAFYYSPYHPSVTRNLSQKPGSLLFEKAIAKLGIDPKASWMIGDKERDLIPAKKLGMRTLWMHKGQDTLPSADGVCPTILEACSFIDKHS